MHVNAERPISEYDTGMSSARKVRIALQPARIETGCPDENGVLSVPTVGLSPISCS
jgi:hypothetical protein